MARKKVNLHWISNSSSRRATCKRRCHGLMKKTGELATLCGINTCVLVYGEGKAQPEVWPSDEEAKQFLKKFKYMPEVGNLNKTHNQEEFLRKRVFKLREEVSKLEGENRELETPILLHKCLDGCGPSFSSTTKDELVSLREMVETKTTKAKARLQQLVGQGALQGLSQALLPPPSLSQA